MMNLLNWRDREGNVIKKIYDIDGREEHLVQIWRQRSCLTRPEQYHHQLLLNGIALISSSTPSSLFSFLHPRYFEINPFSRLPVEESVVLDNVANQRKGRGMQIVPQVEDIRWLNRPRVTSKEKRLEEWWKPIWNDLSASNAGKFPSIGRE